MADSEVRQNLIEKYIDLLRIKKCEKAENEELDFQILATKVKLSPFNIDLDALENRILG